jgi:hypothetical protein
VKSRRINPRLAKIHLVYTVAEVALLFGIDRNTVRAWLRAGLRPIEGGRPTLILGSELRRFLMDRKAKRKRPTPAGHIFCFGCREPRRPALDMADYIPLTATTGNLQGICPDCESMLNRIVSRAKLDAVKGVLAVTFKQADERLCQRAEPSLNHDSGPPIAPHAKTQS